MKKKIKFENKPEIGLKKEIDAGFGEAGEVKLRFGEKHEKILKIISRNGVCPILFSLQSQPMKFSELMFETRLNPGVVDRHLKSLMKLGIIERKENEYQLTETGRKLIPVIEEFLNIMEKL